jgi:two-component system OmpR family sensor kinase
VSLRSRLVIVIAILIATYVAAAFLVVSTQHSELISQTDKRLKTLPLGGITRPPPRAEPAGDVTPLPNETENPFSELYIGMVDSAGNATTLVAGTLQQSTPDIAQAVDATGGPQGIVTIGAVNSATRFRAIVLPQVDTGTWIVAAQSLEETDAAIERLVRTLWIAGAILAVVLGVVVLWVQRLGLSPIARVTATAEAITAGNRSQRVNVRDRRTEAGKLGLAFNLMLDERDLSEARLRQFVADASHELRTPLTSIRGYLELYRQGAFRDQKQMDDVVRRLSGETARMYGLVEDLLALASLDEGRPLHHDPIDLGQVLRDAAQDAQAVQTDRTVTVVAPGLGPPIVGDAALIVQLVGILVSNALAHTPVNAPLTLTAAADNPWAILTVADKGPGLDAEAAAHAFDRFWRGQGSRGRTKNGGRGGGSGLGLSIARSIVDAHGGTIALDTAPGQGCTFTVRLPVNQLAKPHFD